MSQFDLVVCTITLLFITMGFFKGAIKSILGLTKWYGAGVVTLMLYPKVSEILAQYMQPGMVANGITIFITYVLSLILFSIVVGIFVAALGTTVGGPGDRLMGAIVGLTIGIIISSTAHYFIRSFAGGFDPDWIRSGKTYEITQKGADVLQDYFKDIAQDLGSDLGVANVDPAGSLANKIKEFQQQTGSQIDYDKLKQAIQVMKDGGMGPNEIKDLINLQDFSMPAGLVNQNMGTANAIVNGAANQVKQFQSQMPSPPVASDDQE